MLRRSKNFEPSASLGKSVVVTVDYIVTQKRVPVAKLGLNARWIACPFHVAVPVMAVGTWLDALNLIQSESGLITSTPS